MRTLFIFLFCNSLALTLSAQEIINQKTAWYSVIATDEVNNNQEITLQSKFIIDNTTSIRWEQNAGAKVYNFTILSVDSQWTHTSQNGTIRYEVETKGKHGTITVGRVNGSLEISMEFLQDGANTMPFTFAIERIEIL